MGILNTLVEVVLVLLALTTTAGSTVELVANAAQEAAAALLLASGRSSRLCLLARGLALALAVATGKLVDKVHCCEVLFVCWLSVKVVDVSEDVEFTKEKAVFM